MRSFLTSMFVLGSVAMLSAACTAEPTDLTDETEEALPAEEDALVESEEAASKITCTVNGDDTFRYTNGAKRCTSQGITRCETTAARRRKVNGKTYGTWVKQSGCRCSDADGRVRCT